MPRCGSSGRHLHQGWGNVEAVVDDWRLDVDGRERDSPQLGQGAEIVCES